LGIEIELQVAGESKVAFDWKPPDDWDVITTIDAHTAGEPLRVIVDGIPKIPGETILEKRRYAREHLDRFRTGLMWEPRGHADMYGAIITEPVTTDWDLGVLFLHNEGFSTIITRWDHTEKNLKFLI